MDDILTGFSGSGGHGRRWRRCRRRRGVQRSGRDKKQEQKNSRHRFGFGQAARAAVQL